MQKSPGGLFENKHYSVEHGAHDLALSTAKELKLRQFLTTWITSDLPHVLVA